MGRPATDKRDRLVNAALEQFHRRGFPRTSLGDVAKAAGVSAGNVFYYFRTKDELACAVADRWRRLLAGYLDAFAQEPDPWRRIGRFVEQARALAGMYASLGCPLGGLARDLRQEGEALQGTAAGIYAVQFEWLEAQFGFAGLEPGAAKARSRSLMARYHGAILLAFAQGDASLIDDEVACLTDWLRDLRRRALPDG